MILQSLFALATTTIFAATAAATIVTNYESSGPGGGNDVTYDASASSTDLVNTGQATFTSLTSTVTPLFGLNRVNNGVAATSTDHSAFWRNTQLPSTIEFTLNTTVNSYGYDIQTIRSIAGWSGANITQANQQWELRTRAVGSGTFDFHGAFDNSAFSAASNSGSSSRTTLTDTTGVIASNVEVVQMTLLYPGFNGNNSNPGTVYREIDIEGIPTVPEPSSFLLAVLAFGSFVWFSRRCNHRCVA